ncbi:MAG: hypothetical protein HRU27_10015 [Rhizobiaceae bacterium]|nr:hypothetical protein [Hyphomicrobiales bacterium]NRB30918.1 hypothetical protein [Rhizobiaceae bacterium]
MQILVNYLIAAIFVIVAFLIVFPPGSSEAKSNALAIRKQIAEILAEIGQGFMSIIMWVWWLSIGFAVLLFFMWIMPYISEVLSTLYDWIVSLQLGDRLSSLFSSDPNSEDASEGASRVSVVILIGIWWCAWTLSSISGLLKEILEELRDRRHY